jgi:hypothetical protein
MWELFANIIIRYGKSGELWYKGSPRLEPVFLNVYGAQELIPRNEFRQPM